MDNPIIVSLCQNIFLSLCFSNTINMHLFFKIKMKIYTDIMEKYVLMSYCLLSSQTVSFLWRNHIWNIDKKDREENYEG
jgi:hypothetical protein